MLSSFWLAWLWYSSSGCCPVKPRPQWGSTKYSCEIRPLQKYPLRFLPQEIYHISNCSSFPLGRHCVKFNGKTSSPFSAGCSICAGGILAKNALLSDEEWSQSSDTGSPSQEAMRGMCSLWVQTTSCNASNATLDMKMLQTLISNWAIMYKTRQPIIAHFQTEMLLTWNIQKLNIYHWIQSSVITDCLKSLCCFIPLQEKALQSVILHTFTAFKPLTTKTLHH